MSILSKDELMKSVKSRLGNDTSDEALKFLEDVQDTVDSMTSGEDWKTKFEENDAAWRTKYRDRFFSGGSEDENSDDSNDEEPRKYTFEELFEEKEN